jgi:hypothetical protein
MLIPAEWGEPPPKPYLGPKTLKTLVSKSFHLKALEKKRQIQLFKLKKSWKVAEKSQFPMLDSDLFVIGESIFRKKNGGIGNRAI